MDHLTVPHQLAILGGNPIFSASKPVPQVFPTDQEHIGSHGAIASILANETTPDAALASIRQRVVDDVVLSELTSSHRLNLQRRIASLLELDDDDGYSVVCLNSGVHALQAALKALLHKDSGRNEVLVPATTAASTIQAVLQDGFVPVLCDIDAQTWVLDPDAARAAITEKTAAIVAVDWLGTQVNLGPFRDLADKHGLKLISDSAQSFMPTRGKPPAAVLADALIYSFGYSKIFQSGAGGVLICDKKLAQAAEKGPVNLFCHEVMSEVNAFLGLRALDSPEKTLEERSRAVALYRRLLADVPGLSFQHIPTGSCSSFYQPSVVVDLKKFGLSSDNLCAVLEAENVSVASDRMLCIADIPRLRDFCRVSADIPVSRRLGSNSFTLNVFPGMTHDTIRIICEIIKQAHKQAASILAIINSSPEDWVLVPPAPIHPYPNDSAVASKYRNHLVLELVYSDRDFVTQGLANSPPSRALVPFKGLIAAGISVDQLLRRFQEKRQWSVGDRVFGDIEVLARLGGLVLTGLFSDTCSHPLDESGSGTSVDLYVEEGGHLVVRKTCVNDDIDGNGRPWLRRQYRFLDSSAAVAKTNMFVKPLAGQYRDDEAAGVVSITFPYVDSLSVGELAFAGVGSGPMLAVLRRMIGEMATSVWIEGLEDAPTDFIQQVHLKRMEHRVQIARSQVPALDKVASREHVYLNGKKLLGFEPLLRKLKEHPVLSAIQPRKIGEIHGDLTIHNLLATLDPSEARELVLINPRGGPLIDESATAAVLQGERAFEPGDYAYDLSKLLFSISGSSEIRKGLYKFHQADDGSYRLAIRYHRGTETMLGTSRGFLDALESDRRFVSWVERVERSGLHSMRLRTWLGEAAHFVAEAACALGRNMPDKVLPLFLLGLEKLNLVLNVLDGKTEKPAPASPLPTHIPAESPNVGADLMRTALLNALSSSGKQSREPGNWSWDVMEFLVKAESVETLRHLLEQMVGRYFPKGTGIHVSSHPHNGPVFFPCVVIHAFDGPRGQTGAVIAASRRTTEFLLDSGHSTGVLEKLRIVTVTSTGASSRSQFTARDNDKLLSPGSWDFSPLSLSVLQSLQLGFPASPSRGGRWVVESDSVFVLGKPICVSGDGLALLTADRPTWASKVPYRWCISETESMEGRTFAKMLRAIRRSLAPYEPDFICRPSSILMDLVLTRFMERGPWIQLSHKRSMGVNSDLAWDAAQAVRKDFPQVELVHGGKGSHLYHFGTNEAYNRMLEKAPKDDVLNALAYLPTMAKWVHQRIGGTGRESERVVI
ncbi:PLP-dependent transferase [Nemania sp. FL0916]|nr:PLP-dependent transferase [Nemania sp. FL0916]